MHRYQNLAAATFLGFVFQLQHTPPLCLAQGAPNSRESEESSHGTWNGFGHNRNWKWESRRTTTNHLRPIWKQTVGAGHSQSVCDGRFIYVVAGSQTPSNASPTSEAEFLTRVTKLGLRTGKKEWSRILSSHPLEQQESFGGNKPSSQSTPLLIGNKLIVLSFTGVLSCLDTDSGEPTWELDLVKKFRASPVQFGFSSSPVMHPESPDHFIVHAGGNDGGLLCFSTDGQLEWVGPFGGFSYATPTLGEIDGQRQWIVFTQNSIKGIDLEGQELWSFGVKEQGLTNVPSPLVIDRNHVLVSGQGIQGTQCLHVGQRGGTWKASEVWHNSKLQFFCNNWILLERGRVLGSTENYLAALDGRTGKILGRWRELRNTNIVQAKDRLLFLDSRFQLSVLDRATPAEDFKPQARFKVASGKCWAAPTVVADRVQVRQGADLLCFEFSALPQPGDLANQTNEVADLKLSFSAQRAHVAPEIRILETFQTEGQTAALKIYQLLRTTKQLPVQNRIHLAEAAYNGGLESLARMIVADAHEDFPGSSELQTALRRWEK